MTPPFAPGCPWYDLHQRFPPNVKWCEEPLCSVVVEPANTWSNLAYLAIGLWLLLTPAPPDPGAGPLGETRGAQRRAFGWGAIAVGLTSGIYHATTNLPTQYLDFLGMYLFIFLLLARNLMRIGVLPPDRGRAAYFGGVALTSLLTPLWRALGLPIQGIVAVLIVLILVTEALSLRKGPAQSPSQGPVDRRFFFLSLGLLTLGGVSSFLDVSRIACDPRSHLLQGHAVWHLLTALTLLTSSRYYGQFAGGRP